jgi:hypothetical protein
MKFDKGGKMFCLSLFCGGCSRVRYESWNYKFTWAPRNVVLAGQGVQLFVQENYKYIPIVIYLEEQSFWM